MLETGQPIHMYDYDKLTKKEFVVKTGFDEKAILLDGEEYKLEPNDIIVSTDNGVGCVAGVMGADSTKIDENTQNIVIEVATFDGPSLRETARRLNLLNSFEISSALIPRPESFTLIIKRQLSFSLIHLVVNSTTPSLVYFKALDSKLLIICFI